MPDGDIVHVHLAHVYQKVYKQLCEGQYGDEELALEALRALERNIQSYGDEPIKLIEQVVARLEQIPAEPLLREMVDWSEERRVIDKLAQQANGSKRAIYLAVKACKEQVQELQQGECPQDLMFEIAIKYMRNVYISNFEFTFQNPFLFWTKAQMCGILAQPTTIGLVFLTITCDRLRREQPMQCGCCSSCLLRRQTLAVLGIKDQTKYVVTCSHTHDGSKRSSESNHLRAMLYQVNSLRSLLSTVDPWYSISKQYSVLHEIIEQMAKQESIAPSVLVEQLLQLYKRYVHEWDSVQHIVGQGLLEQEEMHATP